MRLGPSAKEIRMTLTGVGEGRLKQKREGKGMEKDISLSEDLYLI